MEKTIIITGGSDGLGKALATDLARDNRVIIISNDETRTREAATELGCEYYSADVRDYGRIDWIISDILAKHERIDVLVNNAGIYIDGELTENDSARIADVIGVNLTGVINCSKSVIPSMKNNKSGLIININSQGGIIAKPERAAYYASKWGITGFTRCLQQEVSKYGIKVTDVMPGLMHTNLFDSAKTSRDMSTSMDTSEVARVVRFIIETPEGVTIPEIGIKSIGYT